jgi:hypothetical protein
MTHARTSPYYPQSNGKVERWQGTLKRDCLRPGVPLAIEEARLLVSRFVQHYNHTRLHSAIGFVTPADRLTGRQPPSSPLAIRSWLRPESDGSLGAENKRRARNTRNTSLAKTEHRERLAGSRGRQ